jgi:hypothetical protein
VGLALVFVVVHEEPVYPFDMLIDSDGGQEGSVKWFANCNNEQNVQIARWMKWITARDNRQRSRRDQGRAYCDQRRRSFLLTAMLEVSLGGKVWEFRRGCR